MHIYIYICITFNLNAFYALYAQRITVSFHSKSFCVRFYGREERAICPQILRKLPAHKTVCAACLFNLAEFLCRYCQLISTFIAYCVPVHKFRNLAIFHRGLARQTVPCAMSMRSLFHFITPQKKSMNRISTL